MSPEHAYEDAIADTEVDGAASPAVLRHRSSYMKWLALISYSEPSNMSIDANSRGHNGGDGRNMHDAQRSRNLTAPRALWVLA